MCIIAISILEALRYLIVVILELAISASERLDQLGDGTTWLPTYLALNDLNRREIAPSFNTSELGAPFSHSEPVSNESLPVPRFDERRRSFLDWAGIDPRREQSLFIRAEFHTTIRSSNDFESHIGQSGRKKC
jgi:hypothetical protein